MRLFQRLNFEVSDNVAYYFVISAVLGEFFFELFVVLPVTKEGILPHYVHVVLGTYVLLNILGNFTMTITNDSSIRKVILPSILKPEWHFCAACEANAPPRTYHCNKCNVCVLKRDHHCTFTRCCIGLKNFRYFVTFLLYLSVGSAYATVFNMYFIWDILEGFSLYSVAIHVVPFIFFIFGYLSIKQFVYTFMSVLSICGVLFVTNLFAYHFRHMLHNQTVFEKNYGIHTYDLGWKNNLVEVMGENWRFAWLFPLIKSPIPSDGLSYKKNQLQEPLVQNNFNDGNLRRRHGAFES